MEPHRTQRRVRRLNAVGAVTSVITLTGFLVFPVMAPGQRPAPDGPEVLDEGALVCNADKPMRCEDAANNEGSGSETPRHIAPNTPAGRLADHVRGATARAPVLAYSNVIDPVSSYWPPPDAMVDDLQLDSAFPDGCDMVSYSLKVASMIAGDPTFDVYTELRTDPCDSGTVIEGTQRVFVDVTAGTSIDPLVGDFSPAVPIPNQVYLWVDFECDTPQLTQPGWVIAEVPEVGHTADVYWEDDQAGTCELFAFGGSPWAGFWASISCEEECDGPEDCDDGDRCTVNRCIDGACDFTLPVTCPDPDECNTAACDPVGTEGNCDIVTPKPNGTPCPDPYFCNGAETCQDGACTPGTYPCAPEQCCFETTRGCEDVLIEPGDDYFETKPYTMVLDFQESPLPGEAFEAAVVTPGESKYRDFDGVMKFVGFDTHTFALQWERLQQLNPCLDGGDTTPIELKNLRMQTSGWIKVQEKTCGNRWFSASMSLSVVPVPQGSLSAEMEHPDGGTFAASFNLQPLFVFTPIGPPSLKKSRDDPGEHIPPAIFDTGVAGLPPIPVQTVATAHWLYDDVLDFVPGMKKDPGAAAPCCSRTLMRGPGARFEVSRPGCSEDRCPDGACYLDADTCVVTADAGACTALGGEFEEYWVNCGDSDGDGLLDWNETYTWDGLIDARHSGTDPLEPDTDDDGSLNDGQEVDGGTDPHNRCDPAPEGVPFGLDCQPPGVTGYDSPDECDIDSGLVDDVNCNGIPDNCEPGACCYKWGRYFMCVDTTEPDCEDTWGDYDSVFQGVDTSCPTEGVSPQTHDGVAVVHVVDSDQECGSTASRARDCTPGIPIDPWITTQGETIEHQFGLEPESPPIPAGFFGTDPDSDAFVGTVYLQGEPLGPTEFGDFGEADTLVRRTGGPAATGDPFDRCELPSATEQTVDAEVVALNLKSTQPIIVTYNGGQNPEEWDAAVDLSETVIPELGEITAVKTDCNNGTYDSVLPVRPRFTFTKVGDPGEVRELDGRDLITLYQYDSPWTSDVSETLGLPSEICTDFHPGVDDADPVDQCDCNANGVRDKCDIEEGVSQDCNENGIPDECEVAASAGCPVGLCTTIDCADDCNQNCVPDECDDDCNVNGIPDDCDITDGTSQDVCTGGDPDGVPDECQDDCDGNGIVDKCEIANDPSKDANGDGILDSCLAPINPADAPHLVTCPACGDCSRSNTCWDLRVDLVGLAGYICGWINGCNDDGDGVFWAAYTWLYGECYCWDDIIDAWAQTSCPPTSRRCEEKSRITQVDRPSDSRIVTTGGATAQILFVVPGLPGEAWQIKGLITIEAPEGTSVMGLEYLIPEGWEITAISDGGAWDEVHRKAKWGPFFGNLSRTVTFEALRVSEIVPFKPRWRHVEPYLDGFSGSVWFDTVSHPIVTD